jgi:hypothetical protein
MCHGLSRTDFHMMLLDGVDLSLGDRGLCEVRVRLVSHIAKQRKHGILAAPQFTGMRVALDGPKQIGF